MVEAWARKALKNNERNEMRNPRTRTSAGLTLAIAAAVIAGLLGCGGAAASEIEPAVEQHFVGFDHGVPLFEPVQAIQYDIAQSEQAFIVPKTGSEFAPGVRADGTLQACDLLNNSQNCVIARGLPDGHKGVVALVQGTPAAVTAIKNQFDIWKTNRFVGGGLKDVPTYGFDGTVIRYATGIDDPNLNLIIDANSSISGVCTGSSGNLTANACFTGSTTGVTKHSPLKGTYHTWADGTVPVLHIDRGQIQGRALSSSQKLNLERQALRFGLDAFAFNVGIEPDGGFCNTDGELPNNPCIDTFSLECIGNAMGDNGTKRDVWQLNPDCGF
jgi:hypothetical protein